jgi:hypothetical protein
VLTGLLISKRPVEGSHEHDNEPSDSTEVGEFLESQERLCSIKLLMTRILVTPSPVNVNWTDAS